MTTKLCLFNFSASAADGGLKRLYAYAQWFHAHGGAWFIIHSNCSSLLKEYPNNHYLVVNPSKFQRLCNDCNYLDALRGLKPYLYYAYGIPMVKPFGKINWFHLSNVLPLGTQGIPLSWLERMKQNILGERIIKTYKNMDILSAESQFSLTLVHPPNPLRMVVSVNGSDDEMGAVPSLEQENVAVVVGTVSYKALEDAYRVFEMLVSNQKGLQFMILGNPSRIPKHLKQKKAVIVLGIQPRSEVVRLLKRAKYYISTTRIENSYNAAAEGIFLANESYISDIGPHQELVSSMPHDQIMVPNLSRPLFHLQRSKLSTTHLKTWDTVIQEMLDVAFSSDV